MKTKFNFKTTILALLLFVAGSTAAFAQCDKTVTLTSSTTNYLNNEGVVQRSKEENVIITLTKTDLTITPGDDHEMTGKISSKTCDWKVPFKEGKTVVKALLTNGNGDDKHVTVTIEGKDGKVTLLFEAEESVGKKIQVVADRFE